MRSHATLAAAVRQRAVALTMADDDVDSLDDGQRWEGGDDDSFPAAGEVKPVTCEVAKTLPLPGTRPPHTHARAPCQLAPWEWEQAAHALCGPQAGLCAWGLGH